MRNHISYLILAVALATNVASATAQDDISSQDVRRNSWSVYVQGGMSWATGLDYKSVDAATGTSTAPEFGAGLNYNIRPWVRLGLNWEISKYQREQRLSSFEKVNASYGGLIDGVTQLESSEGGIAYRKMWTRYNNVDFTVEFNLAEIFKRESHRFNLYLGTGVGMMFAKGNSYELGMGTERWTDPGNTDASGNVISESWTSTGWVKSTNVRHDFNSLYIPLVLSAEYDVAPRFTVGVKGTYKYVTSDEYLAASGLMNAAVVLRYNFLSKKHGVQSNKQMYERAKSDYDALKGDYDALRAQNEKNQMQLDDNQRAMKRVQAENEALKKALDECNKSKVAAQQQTLVVYFPKAVSKVSKTDETRLIEFAKNLKADEEATISLIGEASADGKTKSNQRLSERRLRNVMKILNNNGISGSKISSAKAIGDANRVFEPSARKVEITVHK